MANALRRYLPALVSALVIAVPLIAQTLPEPPVWDAAKIRATAFVIAPGTTTINGNTMTSNLYNGMFTPPLFLLSPGDNLDLLVDDRMVNPVSAKKAAQLRAAAPAGKPKPVILIEPKSRWEIAGKETAEKADQIRQTMAAMMHVAPFYTNVHYHGFGVSPNGNSDNVFIKIVPGEKFQYHVAIPADHPPGLYWYHPHPHELSEQQVLGGMAGPIIISGIEKLRPMLTGLRQRVIVLKDPIFGNNQLFTINGTSGTAVIDIKPGEQQFWRIGNMGADAYFPLTLGGLPFLVVAIDGNLLEVPTPMTELDIPPGGRYEVVVTGPSSGQKVPFKKLASVFYNDGTNKYSYPEATLATLVSAGTPAPAAKKLAASSSTRPDIEEIRRAPVARTCKWTFSEKADFSEYYVNNKVYDVNRIDDQVKLGTYEEWTVVNDSYELHAFHLHQTDFLVTQIDGKPVHMNHTNDVVNIPLKDTVTHSITVKIPFVNPIIEGKFVFHCHVLLHEDRGMMANVLVAKESQPNSACK